MRHASLSKSLLAAALCALAPAEALAHHSPASFDLDRDVRIEGTVAEVAWKNPHVYLFVDTADAAGNPYRQEVEAAPLAVLQTTGLTRDMVAPGARVVIMAHPNRQGPGRLVIGRNVILADGSVHLLYPVGPTADAPTATAAQGLAGQWAPSSTAFFAYYEESAAWPLTAAAKEAQASFVSQAGCDTPSPAPLLSALPEMRSIEIGPRAVVIRHDTDWGVIERTARLGETAHPADVAPSLQGDSIGRWDGATLVIDSTGFAPAPEGVAATVPSGPRKHLVERLSLTDDHRQLRYAVTIEDPDYLAAPVSYSMLWDFRPDVKPSGVACDPDVARRFLKE